MKIKFLKIFWMIYLLEFMIPIALILHYLFGFTADFLSKIPFVLYYIVVVLFHFKRKKINFNLISYLFLFVFLFSFIIGLIGNNPIDGKFLSHIYFTSIPILGISFGIFLAQSYDRKYHEYFIKIINIAFYVTTIILTTYSYLYFSKRIAYWGLGTDLHILIPFLLYQGKNLFVILGVILVLLSGKRATTLNVAMEFLMIFYSRLKSISTNSFPQTILSFILIASILIYASSLGAYSRFESTMAFDFSDDEAMMYATSGRWQELLGIFKYHNSKPIRWFTGSGFGGRYEWFVSIGNYLEYKHYAHFAPVSYIFIYGIPFTIILYTSFFMLIHRSIRFISNPFILISIIGIFSSFFGANLFVDIKLWIFLGIAYYVVNNPNATISKLRIFKS